jgi:membrane associated rhomboid family serine protease
MMAIAHVRNGVEVASFMNNPEDYVFYDFGGRLPELIMNGQLWRLVTPNFLHLGIGHLMFNSLALYQIGPQVEEAYGSQKFIVIYLLTGILSNAFACLFGIRGAGASGAILGLIGLMVAYGHRRGGSYGAAIKRQMLVWAAIGIALGFVLGADNVSHVSGFVAGLVVAYIIPPDPPSLFRSVFAWNAGAVLSAVLVVSSFAMVAVNYGKFQQLYDLARIERHLLRLNLTLRESMRWTAPADGDPVKIAGQLRDAAADVNRDSGIDQRTDVIRARLISLANERAALLESAAVDPAKAQASAQDYAEVNAAWEEYRGWVRTVRRDLGLD